MSDRSSPELFSRTIVGIAVGLAAVLVVGVIVISQVLGAEDPPASAPPTTSAPRTGPLALVPVEAPDAGSAACATLLEALPAALTSESTTLRRLALAEPAPPATVAWAGDRGAPVVLRCGLPRPPELTPTAQLRVVSGVNWLPVPGPGAATWYLVDRPVYVAVTVPEGLSTGPLQEVSEAAGRVLR